jgi:hypothetical protein
MRLYLLAAFCLLASDPGVAELWHHPKPKAACQLWLTGKPFSHNRRFTAWMNNKKVLAQHLCIDGAECAIYYDVNHKADAFTGNREEFLQKAHFYERGGRLRWDVDAGTMNCHSYGCFMVGIPGLNTQVHIESEPDGGKGFESLLERFFEVTDRKNIKNLNIDHWVKENAQNGDLLLFYQGDLIVHTGIVNVHDAKVTVESKLGDFPVAEASASLTADLYPEAGRVRLARVHSSEPNL